MLLASAELRFADLVFHVLAHVQSDVPASVYDAQYVAFAARWLGSAEARSLGEDARALGGVARDRQRFPRLQLLAWLFPDLDSASRVSDRDLAALGDDVVTEPSLLRAFVAVSNEVELLRCAVELERAAYEQLPPVELNHEELEQALATVVPAAPSLSGARVRAVRALARRGRVRAREIWVGAPFEGGPDCRHLAWQAAHEATVAELLDQPEAARQSERSLEAAAIVLMGLRARAAGLGSEHQVWFSRFEGRAGTLELQRLTPEWRDRVSALL